jgi:hypothetical protein
MTNTAVTSPPDQAALIDLGQRFLNAMLDSRGELGTDFWTRARTALEASAATASFPEMVSKCAAKLECHGALSAETTQVIGDLAAALSGPAAFGAFAEECRHNAAYVTAVTRLERDRRKAAAKARKEANTPVSIFPEEPGF